MSVAASGGGTALTPSSAGPARPALEERDIVRLSLLVFRVYEALGEGEWVTLPGGEKRHKIGYLEDFLFSAAEQRKRIATLSGGERARLLLAVPLLQGANLLVLDEPLAMLDPLARHDFMAGVMAAIADDGVSVVCRGPAYGGHGGLVRLGVHVKRVVALPAVWAEACRVLGLPACGGYECCPTGEEVPHAPVPLLSM